MRCEDGDILVVGRQLVAGEDGGDCGSLIRWILEESLAPLSCEGRFDELPRCFHKAGQGYAYVVTGAANDLFSALCADVKKLFCNAVREFDGLCEADAVSRSGFRT